jgi:multimeric flavodoxin WrbA
MSSKHVVAINGSPRRGNTHKLVKDIATLLESHDIRTTVLNLADYRIDDCTGCETCVRKTTWCVQEDGAREVLSEILKADGVVLASPVFVMHVTGKLKSLIDKTASWVHRPPMVGKPALLVSTTQGAGLKGVLGYLEQVVIQWGMHPTGRIGQGAMNRGPVSEREVGSFIHHLNMDRRQYKPSAKQVILYQVQKTLAMKIGAIDREYWAAHGWDQRSYYYPCRISPIKRLIGWGFYQAFDRYVRPINPY